MTDDVPWLTDEEQCLWRGWVRFDADLNAALERQMKDESGLSMSDFTVLVFLTDAESGRVRVTDLARSLQWERSRVSHHVSRMEGRGLVTRAGCPTDGRGAFVGITAAGRTAIEQAAPGHVRAVRRLVFDHLEPDDVRRMGAVFARLGAGLVTGQVSGN